MTLSRWAQELLSGSWATVTEQCERKDIVLCWALIQRPQPHRLIFFQRPHLQLALYWASECQHMNFEEPKTFTRQLAEFETFEQRILTNAWGADI